MQKNIKFTLTSLLILIPLIDSLFIAPAFGLQWKSEQTMYYVTVFLMPIKLLMVLLGGFLLVRQAHSPRRLTTVLYKKLFQVSLFILAGLQSIVLIIVCVLYIVVGTNADKYQLKDKISVYTADSDTLGKATHYFSFQCTDKAGFYSLTPIVTLNKLGDFSFSTKNDKLLIEHNDYSLKGKQLKRIDISMFSCN